MRRVRSCGVLLMTRAEPRSFLLMKHADRWDLPKGHVDPGESDLECALREFEEETGVDRVGDRPGRGPSATRRSTTRSTRRPASGRTRRSSSSWRPSPDRPAIAVTEHLGHEWVDWQPPHAIQANTIDPLLAAVAAHLGGTSAG